MTRTKKNLRLAPDGKPTPDWHPDPHGGSLGVTSRWNYTDKVRLFYVEYRWRGKRISEKAGTKIRAARSLKAQRIKERHDPNFTPPHIAEREAKKEQEAVEETRRPLLFEAVAKRYLAARKRDGKGETYVYGMEGYFRRLSRAFKNRSLADITEQDMATYVEDRLTGTGAFKGYKGNKKAKDLKPQTPGYELSKLGVLYSWLDSIEGVTLTNPLTRFQARQRWRPKEKSSARVPVIPTREQVQLLFDAAPSDLFRAFLKTMYYTGARPESEPCKLLHGDVELPDPAKVKSMDGKPVYGKLIYRETKNGGARKVSLHPEAVEALRGVMLDQPEEDAEGEVWKTTPIFRMVGRYARLAPHRQPAWDRNSYRKAWRLTLKTVAGKHPALLGMVVRDFRNTFITHMREAGNDAGLLSKFVGHSREMNFDYLKLTGTAAERMLAGA